MIPQNVKDILGNSGNSSIYQTLALILFLIFFLGIIFYVFSRPKKYYDEEANAPLDDDIEEKNF